MPELDLIDRFADLVLGADHPRQLGQKTLEVVVAMNRGRAAAIFKPERHRLTLFVSQGIDQAALDAAEAIWSGYRAELGRGGGYYAPERASDKRLGQLAGASEVASVAVVPVLDGESVAALLYVDSATPRFCGDGGLARLGKFARIVAKAVGATEGAVVALPRHPEAAPAPAIAPARGSREELLHALRTHEWNIARAARVLGVTRRTIYLRLARFQIPREKIRRGERRRLRAQPATT